MPCLSKPEVNLLNFCTENMWTGDYRLLGLKRLVFPALNPGGIYKEAHGNSSFKSAKLTKKGNLGWTYSGYHDEVTHGLCSRSSLKLVCSLTCELSQKFPSASGMMHLISNSITTLCVCLSSRHGTEPLFVKEQVMLCIYQWTQQLWDLRLKCNIVLQLKTVAS